MTDDTQKRLNLRNTLVAQLAAVHLKAERLMTLLDTVPAEAIIAKEAMMGLEEGPTADLLIHNIAAITGLLGSMETVMTTAGILPAADPAIVDPGKPDVAKLH